jgi:hypothetical protein
MKKQSDEEKLEELKDILKIDKERLSWLNTLIGQSCPWLSCGIGSCDKYNAPLNNNAMAINLKL